MQKKIWISKLWILFEIFAFLLISFLFFTGFKDYRGIVFAFQKKSLKKYKTFEFIFPHEKVFGYVDLCWMCDPV